MDKGTVIIVDDEAELRHALGQGLDLAGFTVSTFAEADGALKDVSREFYGVLVTDIRMPGIDGLELMKAALEIDPALPVVLITGHGDVRLAVEAMRAGAYDFIEKPFPVAQLTAIAGRAMEKRRLVLENRALRSELAQGSDLDGILIGRTPAMIALRNEVVALAPTDADVLIAGETGSGKEVVARALHSHGPRHDRPFVALNCGALPADIIESELFGHEAGAFTGANKMRVGKLEHANGGTVFLDEIESMPLDLQVKLLRVIETRSIERLGSNKTIPLDLRFVTATKSDLEAESAGGRFRQDLFYRLCVVRVAIPPLRERKDDIPLLFHHLAREARARYRREIPDLTPELTAELMAHDWPGNVRELRNTADRFVLGLWAPATTAAPADDPDATLPERMAAFEKALIAAEIKRRGSLKQVYEALGISRKALYDKMQRYGLAKEEAVGAEEDG